MILLSSIESMFFLQSMGNVINLLDTWSQPFKNIAINGMAISKFANDEQGVFRYATSLQRVQSYHG